MAKWEDLQLDNGRYSVGRKLAQGGYGEVYIARDNKLDRVVVLKVPRLSWLEEPDFAERYRREIRAMAELEHPYIVNVFDIGEHEGRPFVVMELLAGGSLFDCLQMDSGAAAIERLATWLPQVASALDYVHRQDYLHRDVKPSNILFDGRGHARLTDFGIAKVAADLSGAGESRSLTRTGIALGTPTYMAPELCGSGEPIDGRVDQYALAVIVYEALAGSPPLRGDSEFATIGLQLTKLPEPLGQQVPGIPSPLSMAVDRALRKDPAERFESCGSFAAAVMSAVAGRSPHAESVTAAQVQGGWSAAMSDDVASDTPSLPIGCPSCGKPVRMPLSIAPGKRVRCPGCHTRFEWDGDKLQPFTSAETPVGSSQDTSRSWSHLELANAPPFTIASMAEQVSLESGATLRPQHWNWLKNHRLWAAAGTVGLLVVIALWIGSVIGGAGKLRTFNEKLDLKLVWCPPGSFRMGSPADEIGHSKNEDQVPVTLSRGFWLGQTEVTQGQWKQVMETEPWRHESYVKEGSDYPAVFISWEDATEFCRRLTEQERRAGRLLSDEEYMLPTEAQWEYACRAGTTTRYSFGNYESELGDYAWFGQNTGYIGRHPADTSKNYPHRVQTRKANSWGLYDMHGNVSEWCRDVYDEDPGGGRDPFSKSTGFGVNDAVPSGGSIGEHAVPSGGSIGEHAVPSGGSIGERADRVCRGGEWRSDAKYCRSAFRYGSSPKRGFCSNGFRVASNSRW